MTPSYTMHSIQHFTGTGKLGIALLLASPVVSGFTCAVVLHELADDPWQPNLVVPSLLAIISGLAFIVGALAVLIGRESTTTVTRNTVHRSSDYTAENWGKRLDEEEIRSAGQHR